MTSTIEVFQDLHITGPASQMAALKKELSDYAVAPWRYVVDEPVEEQEHGTIMFMERSEDATLPGARLLLWPSVAGYSVLNVVPTKLSSFDYATYNALIQEFVELVATPASRELEFKIQLSKQQQSIEDWFSPSTAQALQSFSRLANRSTGASHPLDQRRWMDFLVAAHAERSKADSEFLYRWLHEVERWPEDTAHELLNDYDFALGLLTRYDESR
jgi:hypothetical protein